MVNIRGVWPSKCGLKGDLGSDKYVCGITSEVVGVDGTRGLNRMPGAGRAWSVREGRSACAAIA